MTTESPSTLPPASGLRVTREGWLAFGVAAAAVVLDQLSKAWVLYAFRLPEKFSVPVVPPIFNLTMVWNPGVSFGLMRADTALGRGMLVAFALVVVAILAGWARKVEKRLTAVALGLVMGGALGNNLIDRIRLGRVADFLDFSGLHFPWVFNVADSAISIGVALLLLDTLLTPATPKS